MEDIFEIVGEFITELFFETSKSKKIPLWIRIPIIVILLGFYFTIIGLFVMIGIKQLNQNFIVGLFLIITALVISICVFIILFQKRRNNRNDNS